MSAISQGMAKIDSAHLKCEAIIKFTTVIKPIELIAAAATIKNAPGKRVRKDVHAIKTISNPVVKM